MAFAALSELSIGRAQCAICARVVRMWDYCGTKDDQPPLHVDMVLVDEKANHIYAEIPGSEAEKFKELIKENEVYVFRKFVVSNSKPAYKPFPSTHMIRFTPWTSVHAKNDMAEKLPKRVFDLLTFDELQSRVGQQEYFVDTIGVIVGVSEIDYVRLPSNQNTTAKRVIVLKDLKNNHINLILWGIRTTGFDATTVHSNGQDSPVVAIFVGMLMKSYNNENTLSGGTACKWYINEDVSEIDNFFDRMPETYTKIEWISAGEQKFKGFEEQKKLEEKNVMELRGIDPWDFEGSGYLCTVTISKISTNQSWWFSSCTKCHRASALQGSQYKCSGGCGSTTAEPKYRLSLVGTDGTAAAEFVHFCRVARQIVGKPVISLIRTATKNQVGMSQAQSEHTLPEIAALVSQKYTFSVSVTQKSLTQRNVSFQVDSIVTFFGKQTCIPKTIMASTDGGTSRQCMLTPAETESSVSTKPPATKKPRLTRRPIPAKKSSGNRR